MRTVKKVVRKWRTTTFAFKDHFPIVWTLFLHLPINSPFRPLSQIYWKCTFHHWTKVRLSWWSIWRCTYRIWLIHFLQWSVSNRKGRRENFQLPCFNPRQQAKLLKFSFSLSYSSFDLFYDLLKRLILSRWEQNLPRTI